MKTIKLVLALVVMSVMVSCNNQGITKKSLETGIDTASYALGLDLAFKLKGNFSEIDRDLLIQGIMNGMDSTDMKIAPEKINVILQEFFKKKQEEERLKQQEAALKNAENEFGAVKLEGEKFLELNKDNKEVVVTDSGLQYIVLKEGSGEKPLATSKVKVHYTGTLIDGTVFDSSVERGTPAEFGVSQVIRGWTEGLQLMSPGAKYKFFIPQDLGYGSSPRQGGKIRPFDALVFEVELIEIVTK